MGQGRRDLPVLATKMLPASPSGSSDPLGRYLAEVRRQPRLDADEERALALAFYEQGDQAAGQRLVTANLRLVIKVAMQYHRQWANLLDLIQEGNIGLMEALRRYDPYREVPFSGYAAWWIRAMILRFLTENFGAIKCANTRAGRKLFFELQKERERLLQAGVEPTARALAERIGVSAEEVERVDVARSPALSLDAPVGPDGDRRIGDVVAVQAASPEDEASTRQMDRRVKAALDAFAARIDDERERRIWESYTIAPDPCSLADLGRDFGVSRERVRQIEARMKRRLREHLVRELGEDVSVALA